MYANRTNEYQRRKAAARDRAIVWQTEFEKRGYSYWELYIEQIRLARLAARYGLIKEFRENGVI